MNSKFWHYIEVCGQVMAPAVLSERKYVILVLPA
jgi:hypothetical protein